MNDELSLREIINEVILFFIKFSKLIIAITIFGVLSVVVYQKTKPSFYSTSAIATSGISKYEYHKDERLTTDQGLAINLINDLQLEVKKGDYNTLSLKLAITPEQASMIKNIAAEQIFREDQDGKKHNTPKFSIVLKVKQSEVISVIESGLLNYFNENQYISNYYTNFKSANLLEISEIDKEISALKELREATNSTIDMSSLNVLARNGENDVRNQIIELVRMRSVNETHQKLIKPLVFVNSFSLTQVAERGVLLLGSFAGLVSFILATIASVFINVYNNKEA